MSKSTQITKRLTAKIPTRGNDVTTLGDSSVTNGKLADLSVSTAKIQDAAVAASKLNNDTVDFILKHNRNYIINGNFDFWQRNTSFSNPSGGQYLADRYVTEYDGTTGTCTISRQAFTLGQTEVPNEPTYFLRIAQTVAPSGDTIRSFVQRIESVRTLAGKTATISFWAKADTNRTLGVRFRQSFGTGGSPSAIVHTAMQNINVTNTWQKFSITIDVPSISGKTLGSNNNDYLAMRIELPLNSTFTFDVAQVMVNEGSYAATFRLCDLNYIDEFSLCKRYYQRNFQGQGFATAYSAANVSFRVPLDVEMRVPPTVSQITGTSLTNILERIGIATATASSIGFNTSATSKYIHFDFAYSGVAFEPVAMRFDIVQADSEL